MAAFAKLVPVWLLRALAGAALLALLLAIVALIGGGGSSSLQDATVLLLINVVLVTGLQVFTGNSGIVSFGHLAFAGVGAYLAAILTLEPVLKAGYIDGLPTFLADAHLDLWPAIAVAVAFTVLVALVLSFALLRLDGGAAVIGTLALLLAANTVFGAASGITRGAGGLATIPRETTIGVALIGAIGAVVAARIFRESAVGLRLRASSGDALAAGSIGVDVRAARRWAWLLSAAICAVGGALLAHRQTVVAPSNFYLQPTFLLVAMLIVGGMRTVSGAVVGAAVVTAIQQGVLPLEDHALHVGPLDLDRLTGLTQVVLVLAILLAMAWRRRGLAGDRELDEALVRAVRDHRPRTPDPPSLRTPSEIPDV